jgi:hypothetical protein
MPINYKNYPKNWKWLSKQIRKRAKNCCELCFAENGMPHGLTGSKVVLTVHHINFDIKDNHELNLIALCQRCHLRLDIREKLKKRNKSKCL